MIIYSPKKNGHYNNYAELILTMFPKAIVINKIQHGFNQPKENYKFLFLDLEPLEILLIPLLRLKGFKIYFLSVSIEELYYSNTSIRRKVFEFYKSIGFLRIISILKNNGTNYNKYKCVDYFVFDPQYYDLKYLRFQSKKPIEICTSTYNKTTILIVANTSNKYDVNELNKVIKKATHLKFIIVSRNKMFEPGENVVIIDRFISDSELIYLMERTDYIFAGNNTNRPSGIFGRAVQLNKTVIIFQDSFNSRFNYANSILIEHFHDIENISEKPLVINFNKDLFDDFKQLQGILS